MFFFTICGLLLPAFIYQVNASPHNAQPKHRLGRERINLNSDWKFRRWEENPDGLIYDYRQDLENLTDVSILKPWILPSGNNFIKDSSKHYQRPEGNPGSNVSFVQNDFDDQCWTSVTLPHDWAIAGPFYTEPDGEAIVGGGMGRLPVFGIGWYRRKLHISNDDKNKQIQLELGGAMSYAMVWLNGKLIGGWPYPYNSFQLDLTPHLQFGQDNQIAIRLDNPVDSARWYPGGGLYRDVWLTKTEHTHVNQWGTRFTTRDVSNDSAVIDLQLSVGNTANYTSRVSVITEIYQSNTVTGQQGRMAASFPATTVEIEADDKISINQTLLLSSPQLWGPPPTQTPNTYIGVTRLLNEAGIQVDAYETRFGIRKFEYTGDAGLRVNGERVRVQGVNEHHDLGALGAAFNVRAAERKLEILRELGVNAIRMAHNPPASELLDLTDKMGFLVFDEVFDSWERNKTANDFHLIFSDWHEQDLRAMIRRDANHPSIMVWSIGNEVGEQNYTQELTEIATTLYAIAHDEDPTRPVTASMNFAQPGNNGAPFPDILDVLSINYQGEGIRDTPNYAVTKGINTKPAYPLFHEDQPDKLIWTSESASTVSTRGTYFFPVTDDGGAPVNDSSGGNTTLAQVSAYELYSANFGSSPDKVFATQDQNTYVGGEFVWTGFDYIGEPTPYYTSRSSYSGIIDLAGFKKDRFYLYQARWRPDLPMVHILPHWNWAGREGQVTPVHVFTSGDEAELFLNNVSMGRQHLDQYEYRLRWDKITYEPGELHVVSYKAGKLWAEATVRTTGPAVSLRLTADRQSISADGVDLSYITADVLDSQGSVVPTANPEIEFSVSGSGEIIATDNGDPADLVAFTSTNRKAFSGKALAIVKASKRNGTISVVAKGEGLTSGEITLNLLT
ncbi:unnamed protein product [Aureobasidium pullulans]|nr:unnamed protein product [Aureobasidium pullulans]